MSNIFGNYIQRKRLNMNLSLRKFAELCSISHTHIDSIEKGKDFRNNKPVKPTSDTIYKIATALKVDQELLFTLSLEQTSEKFDFYYDNEERQKIIEENIYKISDETLYLNERINSAELMFKAFYSESIEFSKFSQNHIDYENYVAMLLNSETHWKDKLSEQVYDNLNNTYGRIDGINLGETIYLTSELIENARILFRKWLLATDTSFEYIKQALGIDNYTSIRAWANGFGNILNDRLPKIAELMGCPIEILISYPSSNNINSYYSSELNINKVLSSIINIDNLNDNEARILESFKKLNEEKQNKVIGYAEAQLNDDDNIYYIGYNAAMGGERTETIHTKDETKKLNDAFEAEFKNDITTE